MSAAPTIQFASTLLPTVSAGTGKTVSAGGDGFALLLADATLGEPAAAVSVAPPMPVTPGAVPAPLVQPTTTDQAATVVLDYGDGDAATSSPADIAVAVPVDGGTVDDPVVLLHRPMLGAPKRQPPADSGNPVPVTRQPILPDAPSPASGGTAPAASAIVVDAGQQQVAAAPTSSDDEPASHAAAPSSAKSPLLRARLLATAMPATVALAPAIGADRPTPADSRCDEASEGGAASSAVAEQALSVAAAIPAPPPIDLVAPATVAPASPIAVAVAAPGVTIAPNISAAPARMQRSNRSVTVASDASAPAVTNSAPAPRVAAAARPAAPARIVGGAALQALGNPVASATIPPAAAVTDTPAAIATVAPAVLRAEPALPGVADPRNAVPAAAIAGPPSVIGDAALPMPAATVPPPATMATPPSPVASTPLTVAAAPITSLLAATSDISMPVTSPLAAMSAIATPVRVAIAAAAPSTPPLALGSVRIDDVPPAAPLATASVTVLSPLPTAAANEPALAPTSMTVAPTSGEQVAPRLALGTPRSAQPVAQPALVTAAAAPVASPMPAATAVGTTAPAAQAFAASIAAADRQDRLAATRGSSESVAAAAATSSTAPIAAAAGANADQPSLDMRQQGWPGAMVDHIEKLRDAADATSMRIRIVPDALGTIDVSVRRHDDGGVQVSLVADRAQTQAMIAEARPELTRLADERGTRLDVSLGNGSTGGGTASFGGNADGRQPAAQPQVAQRRAPASTFPPDEPTDSADGRVA